MASGQEYRANRPNTWLLRPTLQVKILLANPEPPTHGPSRHIAPPHKLDRSQGKADIADAALNMWLMSTSEALAFLAVVAALTVLALTA
jgi:hypothetical protein